MPSSNGVYSLPVGYLAVTGSTIQASQHNPPLEDIAAALTGRLSRDGTAPMTGALALAAGTVAAPGAVFATDPTSGLYKTTAGIGVAVGGVKVAEFVAGGIVGARLIGELVPFTGASLTAAPALWVMPFGQTLSRTTYAALWAFAQIQIAAGSIFYNNGNGSTTFGIGDMRGRVPAGNDALGGTNAGRLSSTVSPNGSTAGASGGFETQTLTAAQTPTITSSPGTPWNVVGSSNSALLFLTANAQSSQFSANAGAQVWNAIAQGATVLTQSATASGTVTSNNTGGAAHPNVQPTLVCNYILFAGA